MSAAYGAVVGGENCFVAIGVLACEDSAISFFEGIPDRLGFCSQAFVELVSLCFFQVPGAV